MNQVIIKLENVFIEYERNSVRKSKNNLMSRLLVAQNLEKFYSLKNVTFELSEGDKVALVGQNGSGKSTLLKVLSGILPHDSGEVTVNGKIKSMLKGTTSLVHGATCLQNIKLAALRNNLSGEEYDTYMSRAKNSFGYSEFNHSPVNLLSAGMENKLKFAIELNFKDKPEILLMDEWIGTSDFRLINQKYNIFMDTVNESKIFVLASHNFQLLKKLCNKCIWLEKGEVKEFGTMNEVYNKYINSIKKANIK